MRVTHNRDIVPSVPLQIMGFHHVPNEIWQASLLEDLLLVALYTWHARWVLCRTKWWACRDSIWSCPRQQPAACGCTGHSGALTALAAAQGSPTCSQSLPCSVALVLCFIGTEDLAMRTWHVQSTCQIGTLQRSACFWLMAMPARPVLLQLAGQSTFSRSACAEATRELPGRVLLY